MAEDEEELIKLRQKAEKSDGKMKEIENELSAAKVAFFTHSVGYIKGHSSYLSISEYQ